MVSSVIPHVGQEEWDCSFHRRRFLAVAQNSAVHFVVSIRFAVEREEKAFARGVHAIVWAEDCGMLYFLTQYDLAGVFVSSVYSVLVKKEVILTD